MSQSTVAAPQHALVRWCEDPPKWDVVNVKDIKKSNGVGAVADVQFQGQVFPAVIIEFGKANALERKLLSVADNEAGCLTPEEEVEIANPGKRCRKKGSSQKISNLDRSEHPRTVSQSCLVRRHERLRTEAMLTALNEKNGCGSSAETTDDLSDKVCHQCEEKDDQISALKEEVECLKAKMGTMTSMSGSAQRIEAAVSSLEDIARTIRHTANGPGTAAPARMAAPDTTPRRPAAVPQSPVARPVPAAVLQSPTAGPTPMAADAAASFSAAGAAETSPVATTPATSATEKVTIGPCTEVDATAYRAIDWANPKRAVKDLLVAVFTRDVLARSSLTGGRSNANGAEVAARPALDPVKLNEMIGFLERKLKMKKSELRVICRAKVNDETKLLQRRTAIRPAPEPAA